MESTAPVSSLVCWNPLRMTMQGKELKPKPWLGAFQQLRILVRGYWR